MNLSLVHFMSALGSSAALGPSAANLLTPKFSRNTARAHMNVKLMDTAIPIRKLQGDDILGVRGVGIVRTAAIGGVGIDTNAMANVADGVVGDGVRGVGGIVVGGSVRGVGISSLPGISSVLLPEGGGGLRNKISVRAHDVRACCSNSLCTSKDMSHGRNEKEYIRYVRYGESREQRYESREEQEFRCAIARSEFGKRKQVFRFVFKSWCTER